MKKTIVIVVALSLLTLSALVVAQDSWDYLSLGRDLADQQKPFQQLKAMRELSLRGDPEAIPQIVANLDSLYMDVRIGAIRSLARYENPSLLPYFEEVILLNDLYTVNERILAIRLYLNMPGYDEEVLKQAVGQARNPMEAEVLRRVSSGESFNVFGGGK